MRLLTDIAGLDSFVLTNASIPAALRGRPSGFTIEDIAVSDGRIVEAGTGPCIDAGGSMVTPTFVDMHTHLDKGHIWPRSPNPDGTFDSALSTVELDRRTSWTAADVRRRMEFALKSAFAHGTGAIRSHIDSAPPQHAISWPVFAEMRSDWSGRIELQATTIIGIDAVGSDGFIDVANTASEIGGHLGCVVYPQPDLDRRLRLFFRIAEERGMEADFHVDETGDPASAGLRAIAQAVIDTGFSARVVVGHCCSLSRQADDEARHTLDLAAEAGLCVVSLPMCNLYLQDRRPAATPIWRGVTLVHEMRQRGIPVAFASDNTRDPFFAYGDLDMVEVMREATRICHLDHSASCWSSAFSAIPADICGFDSCSLRPGEPADFIVFSARDWSEFFARPQADRIVIRNGRPISGELPDYRELDDLMNN